MNSKTKAGREREVRKGLQEQGQGINWVWNMKVSPPIPAGQYSLSPSFSL